MNRDHLMGYPAAGIVSGDCPDKYDDTAIFDYKPFALGIPKRVYIAQRNRLDAIGRKKAPLRDFENIPQPNPDGSYTPKHPGRLFGKEPSGYAVDTIKGDGPVVQASEYVYSEGPLHFFDATKHAENPLTQAPWKRPAIPLSQLIPPGLMVGGSEPARDGDAAVAASIRDVFNRCKPGGAAQQLLGRQLESLQQRPKVIASDALAAALHRMNTDPDYRAKMAERITAVNEKLRKEGFTKGDGGIAMPEIAAAQDMRFTAVSIPIAIHSYGPEFDFPPNA